MPNIDAYRNDRIKFTLKSQTLCRKIQNCAWFKNTDNGMCHSAHIKSLMSTNCAFATFISPNINKNSSNFRFQICFAIICSFNGRINTKWFHLLLIVTKIRFTLHFTFYGVIFEIMFANILIFLQRKNIVSIYTWWKTSQT